MAASPLVRDFAIGGMTCASCVGRVERQLAKVPGVAAVAVNLATERARVTLAESGVADATLLQAVEKAGFEAAPLTEDSADPALADDRAGLRRQGIEAAIALALALPLTMPMIGMVFGQHWMLPPWLEFLLAAPVQLWFGRRFYVEGWKAARAGSGNMELLVALGTSAAFGLSLWLWGSGQGGHLYFEAASVVIALVLLGKLLEKRARAQTLEGLKALAALRPAFARRRRDDGSDVEVPIALIRVGDIVAVRPGERIPVDGIVQQGDSMVDEALLTGESRAIIKGPGDKVTGGAINGDGLLLVTTSAVGAETVLARIVRLVEDAQSAKAPIQRLVDRVAAIFVPVVLLVAAATLIGWLMAGASAEIAIIHAVTVMVIACPCALGLATPTALMVGTGVAARHGILIRDADVLERAHHLKTVLFDKTGTLTEGRPIVRRVVAVDGDGAGLIRLAAALQAGSEHPLARAVQQAAIGRGGALALTAQITALPGRGIRAVAEDGRVWWLGNSRLMREQGINLTPLTADSDDEAAEGATVTWMAEGSRLLGLLSFGDAVREHSARAVAALQRRGLTIAMLTGDSQAAAIQIAAHLGIRDIRAELLPEDKASIVASVRTAGPVAMVGDGVNDAPALAAADLGIAMGSGTDVAIKVAGITLMRSDPLLVVAALDISHRTYTKIRQNLFWAFLYNLIGMPLAAFGLLSPVAAGAAMAASSVSVVTSALLLRRWRPDRN